MKKNDTSVVFYYEHHTNDSSEKELIKNLLRRYNISIFALKYKRFYFSISIMLSFVALIVAISMLNYGLSFYKNKLQMLNAYSVLPILTIVILLISVIIILYIGYILLKRGFDVYQFVEDDFIESYRMLIVNPLETSGTLVEVKRISGLLRQVVYRFEIEGKTIHGHYSTTSRDWLDIEIGKKISINYVNNFLHVPIIISTTIRPKSVPR